MLCWAVGALSCVSAFGLLFLIHVGHPLFGGVNLGMVGAFSTFWFLCIPEILGCSTGLRFMAGVVAFPGNNACVWGVVWFCFCVDSTCFARLMCKCVWSCPAPCSICFCGGVYLGIIILICLVSCGFLWFGLFWFGFQCMFWIWIPGLGSCSLFVLCGVGVVPAPQPPFGPI